MQFTPNFDNGNDWATLFHYSFDPENQGPVPPLGRAAPQVCRFCGESAPAAKFRKDAHVIPAAFGNRALLHLEECDRCNAVGSQLEDALCNMLAVARMFSRTRTRKGPLKYRFGKSPSSIQASATDNVIRIKTMAGDDSVVRRHTLDGVSYAIRVPSYSPARAIKALARMGLFVASDSTLQQLAHLRAWIQDKHVWMPAFFRAFIPGPGLANVSLRLQEHTIPHAFRVVFAYSTDVLVLHLPDASWKLPNDLTLPFLALSPYSPHIPQWTLYEYSHDIVVPSKTDTIYLHVPAISALPHPSHMEIQREAYNRYQARVARGEDGSELGDWLTAEQDIIERRAASVALQQEDMSEET